MLNKKHFIKMHICESAFHRRNLFLHKANETNKINETIEENETIETDETNKLNEINKRNN